MDDQSHLDYSTEGTSPVYMPGSDPVPEPEAPAENLILLPAPGPGSAKPPLSKRMKFVLGLFSAVILLSGLVTSLVLIKQRQNVNGKAWSGFSFNQKNVADLESKSDPDPLRSNPSAEKVKVLFNQLTKSYYDAEVQNVNDEKLLIKGVVFLKYDEKVNSTFVFSRIERLPVIPNKIVRLWINKDLSFEPVGVAEFMMESKKVVSYSVFAKKGDLRSYKTLFFSYDSSPNITFPEIPILNVSF